MTAPEAADAVPITETHLPPKPRTERWALPPEELIKRCICPVKREFVLTSTQRVLVEAVTGTQEETAEGTKKLSKRAQGKARREQRSKATCYSFLSGNCMFGDSCRFVHDIDAFLAERMPDLPGSCPFIAAGKACPYGLQCRYGASPNHTAGDGTTIPPPPTPTPMDIAPPSGQRYVKDGTIPPHTLPLPLPSDMQQSVNMLTKELQGSLRKCTYDFEPSDTLLRSMGVAVHKYGAAKRQAKRQKTKGGDTVTPDAAATITSNGATTAMDAPPPPAAAETPTAMEPTATEAPTHDTDNASPPVTAPPTATPTLEVIPCTTPCAAVDTPLDATGVDSPLNAREKTARKERFAQRIQGKSYLAPLTTVGNLPFRRMCKGLGADITCGEMALATNLLQGQHGEWALLRRHPSEDLFGVQVCGGFPDTMTRCAQLLNDTCEVDFVDVNCGCPIDLICEKGAGSALMTKVKRMENVVKGMSGMLDCPLTVKMRKGYLDTTPLAHTIVPQLGAWGAAATTVHGRTRQQRYSRVADWDYIKQCASVCKDIPLIGNGDCYSYTDFQQHLDDGVATVLIARGALVKPWIFTEIKEQRHWDISASERLDMLKVFCSHGLENWGSDQRGVERTRNFLLEWLSYTCRYVPVGLLEVTPAQLNWRPPPFKGRNDLETLLSSTNAQDWVRISEMLLGPAPKGFVFAPKHKSNAYATTDREVDGAYGMEES